jgi:2,3-bisphosphoglycerate-independent phosphoglycerate mutase
MTEYDETFHLPIAFAPTRLVNILGQVLANAGIPQARIAETEKYPHVTFFFNGGEEEPLAGEDRCLIPSPKVATYDLKPEMSAEEVTAQVIERLRARRYGVFILNYANPDMVGHTGVIPAAIKAVETVDRCVGQVLDVLREVNGVALVTADHGNAERMIDENGTPHTAHTCNPVHLFYVGADQKSWRLKPGSLCDIAPTILALLKLPQPKEMTGVSLLEPVS